MGQIEVTSPYDTFELYSRTPLPPDLAKTRRFQRPQEPETTRFTRQPVDDTVPFSPFDGAELAIMPPLAAPAATPPSGTRQVEVRRPEDDSIEIVIVDSGEIERVAPLELDVPPSDAAQIEAELEASVSVELSGSSLEPLESSFFLPVAVAEPSEIATPRLPTEVVRRPSWKLPLVIALFLAGAFACGIGAAFALS